MSYTPDQTEKGILEKLIAGRMDYNTLWYGCRSLKSNRWNPYGIHFGCRFVIRFLILSLFNHMVCKHLKTPALLLPCILSEAI